MLDKLYKVSVILIAATLVALCFVAILQPSQLFAQKNTPQPAATQPAPAMYAIPESHEWEAITENTSGGMANTFIYNKRTGETWRTAWRTEDNYDNHKYPLVRVH